MTEANESVEPVPRSTPWFDRAPRWVWAAYAILVAILAVHGVFTLSKIFYFRDLSSYHWPHHVWSQRTLVNGESTFWDPNPGGGYATAGDPALLTFFPPAIVLRFLPGVVGFNLLIALPFPLAALGMYLFIRRHASHPASALAACVYALSGPILSTANCNNIAWCCAFIPWILLSVDRLAIRPSARGMALTTLLFALDLCAGEPVTLFWTAVLATLYAAFAAPTSAPGWRSRAKTTAATIGAGLLGAALSAIQVLPMIEATRVSIRGAGRLQDTWSLHPLRTLEAVLPNLFGNFLGLPDEISPWLLAVNSDRDPLLLSTYVGVGTLLLAVLGIVGARNRRWAYFWSAVGVIALFLAFGSNTPIYPGLQKILPFLEVFRFPTRIVVFTALALAPLAAAGWDALVEIADERLSKRRLLVPFVAAGLLAGASGLLAFLALASPGSLDSPILRLATALGIPGSLENMVFLASSIGRTAPQLCALTLAVAGAMWLAVARTDVAMLAHGGLIVVLSVELLAANIGLNPTMDVANLSQPSWVETTRAHPHDRVQVIRAIAQEVHTPGPDDPPRIPLIDDIPPTAYLPIYHTALGAYPSLIGVREVITPEITGLRRIEYLALTGFYETTTPETRYRFLNWAGARYVVASSPPPIPATPIQPLSDLPSVTLYETSSPGSRVQIIRTGSIEPSVPEQVKHLFLPSFDPTTQLLLEAEPPPPAGVSGTAQDTSARIVKETTTSVDVEASVAGDAAYLMLLDTYDESWRVEVDGAAAQLLRADGIFRAVRLAPGPHTVRFHYASTWIAAGFWITLLTALGLAVACIRRPRRAASAPPETA